MKNILMMMILCIFGCKSDVTRNDELIGKTLAEVEATYSNFESDTTFYLHKDVSLYEYQGSLYEILEGLEDKDSVKIREIAINLNNTKSLIIWFESDSSNRWIAIDNIIYRDNIKF